MYRSVYPFFVEFLVRCRDAEVKEEAFLEYINQLLMTGEVAGLFPKDELDMMLNDIRPIMKAECPGQSSTNNYAFLPRGF
jgi:dynein heavy chain, axonemal